MNSYAIKTRTEKDGRLLLDIPTGIRNEDIEVVVIVQSHSSKSVVNVERLGWPVNFFEETAGALAHDPIEREYPGDYETREILQ